MSKRPQPVSIARVYDLGEPIGEYRTLVDRLWPRGVARASLTLDDWCKELAPSPDLRKWFGHRPERWDEFRERYTKELEAKPEALASLAGIAAKRPVLLIYAARDPEHNHAIVLREVLLQTLARLDAKRERA